jgi:hypothetical protein
MKSMTALLVLLCALILPGCATRSLAPADTDALAKQMRPVEGKAVVYIFRNEEYSTPWPIGLTLDGKDATSTSANTYVRWVLEPGQHIIASHAENDVGLVLQAEAGRVYYVWHDVTMGYFRPRANLRLVDRTTAEVAMRTCYLLANAEAPK